MLIIGKRKRVLMCEFNWTDDDDDDNVRRDGIYSNEEFAKELWNNPDNHVGPFHPRTSNDDEEE